MHQGTAPRRLGDSVDSETDGDDDFWSVASNDVDLEDEDFFAFPKHPLSHAVEGNLDLLEDVLPGIPPRVRGCVPALRRHAAERPNAAALTWITQSGKEGPSLTYAELEAAAAAAARAKPLVNLAPGERVIIAHPPGLEFSVAGGDVTQRDMRLLNVIPRMQI